MCKDGATSVVDRPVLIPGMTFFSGNFHQILFRFFWRLQEHFLSSAYIFPDFFFMKLLPILPIIPATANYTGEPGTIDISQLFSTTTTKIDGDNITHTSGSVEFEIPNQLWLW